jgi:hypothetical protein
MIRAYYDSGSIGIITHNLSVSGRRHFSIGIHSLNWEIMHFTSCQRKEKHNTVLLLRFKLFSSGLCRKLTPFPIEVIQYLPGLVTSMMQISKIQHTNKLHTFLEIQLVYTKCSSHVYSQYKLCINSQYKVVVCFVFVLFRYLQSTLLDHIIY